MDYTPSKYMDLKLMISSLSVFGKLRDDPAVKSLFAFLKEAERAEGPATPEALSCLADFASELFSKAGGDLPTYLDMALKDIDSPYLRIKVSGKDVPEELESSAKAELEMVKRISLFSPEDAKELLNYGGYIPIWTNNGPDIPSSYIEMIRGIATKGYGEFAKHFVFKVAGSGKEVRLDPVLHPDPQTLESLYGYEEERKRVFDNTKLLAEGGAAENALLYGDAGTGKSSTIKACANHFAGMGVRLVEFDKSQISEIPGIIDRVYDSPLKFIFFIDDLSFSSEDDDFCYLKGILEGNATGKSDNIVIYATSNRRHLIKETSEDRLGSEIHVNDTLQQQTSLAARFGLRVTFGKPGKDLYLTIVKELASEAGLEVPEDALFEKAERFALYQNGRSPRTAKQLIRILKGSSDI